MLLYSQLVACFHTKNNHQKQQRRQSTSNKLGSFVAKSASSNRDPLTLRGPIVARLVDGDHPGSRDRFLSERGKVSLWHNLVLCSLVLLPAGSRSRLGPFWTQNGPSAASIWWSPVTL